ncbi:hypothetical protein SCLARK_001692 [Spiroplasma clarkii]|uniref:tRNA (adenosine(37)-N6)-threonylcarbamoyltransferase complex ATPase subunit type 1 TsaE n=1 Tax=Spiroplasma clarkii TaxID=2139 RepID=UPI000B573C95|nr:tRNA (adenosine(37)-N6)-threonylcarbamoyltransferase complex ATPase subunit type 1 TsaE [Spiroplasma clarkii]ARU92156.1 hypothetical protein SCLARK_001692 [Spiroplasma clarkii]
MIIKNFEQLDVLVDSIKPWAQKNTCLILNGEMGAGKTTFTKNLLAALGVQEMVNSPTFIIMNQYQIPNLKINHVDAYRLAGGEESQMYLEQFLMHLV